MESVKLSEGQLAKFRDLMNRSINVLLPDIRPGQKIELPEDKLRLVVELFAQDASAAEVKAYIEIEQKKWATDESRKPFLDNLMRIIDREIEILEFYPGGEPQTEFPMPQHVKIIDVDNPNSDRTMPIEVFYEKLRAVRNSSLFKK